MRVVVRTVVLASLLAALAAQLMASSVGAAQPSGPPPAEPRVVEGEPASTREHPWMVALVTSAGSPYCGGALVAADRVLTAAHCVVGRAPAGLRVLAGRTDLRTDDGVLSSVRDVWVHPQYQSPLTGDDIAVLTLDRAPGYASIEVNDDPAAYPPGRPATVLGWGYTTEQGPVSQELRRANVPLVADADCAASYREYNQATMVCAGEADGGPDACAGDSGGPLVAGGRLVGVTSWGSGCGRAGLPGVYVRIATYADLVRAQLS